MRYVKRSLSVLGLIFTTLCGPALHAQEQIELESPAEGYYQPTARFIFTIPRGMPIELLQRISLELDNIDMTAFIQREGDSAYFEPPQPLDYGAHQLRLVEYAPDGAINELALWTIQVRRTAAFREADTRANLDIASTQRISDKNVSDDIPSNTRQGGLAVETRVADDAWHLQGNLGIVHNSQVSQMPHDRHTDLANVLLEGSTGNVAVRAGDHVLPASSLVLRDFARRGISGSARLDTLRSEVTAFAMRSNTISGFRHGFGVGDSDNRTDGVIFNVSPLTERPERLQVGVVHLRGHGSTTGDAVEGDAEAGKGDASSLVVDSLLYEQRLRLRGEVARSRADLDGDAVTLGSESDSAYSLFALYQHPQSEQMGAAFNWNAGVEQSTVGPDFFSLGNATLPADKRLQRLFTGFNWGGWAINAQLARETDNVDDDPNLPRMRSDYLTLGTTYMPQWEPVAEGFLQLFNQPSLSVVLQDMSQRYDSLPLGFGGNNVDQDTRILHASLRFVPGTWAWDISHTLTRFDDAIGVQADYNNTLTELGFDIMLGERYSLRPRIQYNRLQDRDNNVETRTTTGALGITAALIPGKLDASLDYSLNREEATDNSVDTNTYMLNGMLAWQVRAPNENRPGISLFASGSYHKDRNATSDTPVYQIFAGLRIGWPVTY